jgi:hypothetical protein
MVYSKEYYEEKFKDKLTQRGKAIERLVTDIYTFVKEHDEVIAELNKIKSLLEAEQKEETKTPPKAKSK